MTSKSTGKRARPVRVGVFGIGRGQSFAAQAEAMEGVKLVAICDQREQALADFARQHPQVTTYTDYDRMLAHDLDAVVLANYATEHAPAAIKAMQREYDANGPLWISYSEHLENYMGTEQEPVNSPPFRSHHYDVSC